MLIGEIARVIPALPVALVATALIESGEAGISELALKARVHEMINALEARGAHVHIPRADHDYAVTAGLRMLEMRHIAQRGEDGMIALVPGEETIAAYYANSIAHLLG